MLVEKGSIRKFHDWRLAIGEVASGEVVSGGWRVASRVYHQGF